MSQVAVVGTTTWGTTLAILLARRGHRTYLWARTEEEARWLRDRQCHPQRLPDVPFPPGLAVTSSLDEALVGADLLILAVPSQDLRANVQRLSHRLSPSTLVLSATKGIEVDTGKRMSEVMAEVLGPEMQPNICVLSGPNLAGEIARRLPAATVVAAADEEVARRAQDMVMVPHLRVYTHTDVVGVEMGGALKNVIALAAGISDGLGSGENARAGVITRGLAEITRLAVAAGAHPLTLAGLAGLGDLVVTCSSRLSRNHRVGEELARGRQLKDVLHSLGQVAEGVSTTAAARQLAARLQVEMPITEEMYRVLFEGLDVREGVARLMARDAKPEQAVEHNSPD